MFRGTILFICLVSSAACTNIDVNQTEKRFQDNMNGRLAGFNNVNPANPNDFHFSAMGDTHIGSDTGGTLFATVLSRSQAMGDAFAVIAGDNTNSGLESEMHGFQGQRQSVTMPSLPAIGNHDIFFGGWGRYKSIIGKSIYTVDAGLARLFFLDTANGTFGESQLNWIREQLLANTKPIKIVVMHFPIYTGEFSSLFKLSSDEEATIFKAMMNEFGVQLVISGHYHGFNEKDIGGTKYVVSGNCNKILDLGHRSGYARVRVTAGGVAVSPIFID
ncbi:MAG: metallophosphoesterase [Oligoflexia bacterium]|nr:metallophosphoesterase [Oligoflexia bacterium]